MVTSWSLQATKWATFSVFAADLFVFSQQNEIKKQRSFFTSYHIYLHYVYLNPPLSKGSSTHSRVLVQGVGPGHNSSSGRSEQLSIKSHGPNKICLVWELTHWRIFTSTFLLAISLSQTKSIFFPLHESGSFFDRPIGGWHKKEEEIQNVSIDTLAECIDSVFSVLRQKVAPSFRQTELNQSNFLDLKLAASKQILLSALTRRK